MNSDQQASTGNMLVATLYDMVTEEHHPFYHQSTIGACLRAAKAVTKDMDQNDFRMVIHGEWNARSTRTPFQPYLEGVWYKIDGTITEIGGQER
ncbi:MAG: hypothetical protein [Arizlama microvirus]|nr:MAG: hypothetical protein [Arizlama microvirus]